jgi:hypothetical protein
MLHSEGRQSAHNSRPQTMTRQLLDRQGRRCVVDPAPWSASRSHFYPVFRPDSR